MSSEAKAIRGIERQREFEDKLRAEWKNDKDISHHEQHVSFSFPTRRGSDFSTRDVVSLLKRRRLYKSGVNEANITVKREVLKTPKGFTYRMDVIFKYGHVNKGIVNVAISRAIRAVIGRFEDPFLRVKVRISTKFHDGTWASVKPVIIKDLATRTPVIKE